MAGSSGLAMASAGLDPNAGSVNQMVPLDLHTTSFGELSALPSKLSSKTVIVPSCFVRVTRRVSAGR